jgi:amino acid transporter
MKIIKWIGHPVILVVLYLLLIIEGDEFGGFYMLYLFLSLPHLVPYSIIAAAGLSFIIIAFNSKRSEKRIFAFYLFGYLLMLLSLIIFFSKGNKWKTFELDIPLLSFIVFGISSLCFLGWIFSLFQKSLSKSARIIS